MRPKISVIIPCYNGAETILETLASAENQSYDNLEIVVVDDGSTDATAALVEQRQKDSGRDILLLRQKNVGVSAARNNGLSHAAGEYVAFLDSDDLLHREFLRYLYDAIKDGRDFAVCRHTYNPLPADVGGSPALERGREALLDRYFHKRKNALSFFCGLYRKEIIDAHTVRFPEGVKYGEDSDFFCTYLYHCARPCAVLDAPLYQYVRRPSSATGRVDYDKTQNIAVFQKILKLWSIGLDDERGTVYFRAVWSCAKDFAQRDETLFRRFSVEYPVKEAMRRLVFSREEWQIRLSALAYLINENLFRRIVSCATTMP